MQSQVKIFCCLALFCYVFHSQAAAASDTNWSLLSSQKWSIAEASSAQGEVISSYLPAVIEIGRAIWGWDPKKELKNTPNSVLVQESVYAETSNNLHFNQLMQNLFVQFDVSNTRHFRKVWITPREGLKFRGLFGIHDFNKPRPFVIIRMGVHGNVDEFNPERFIAKAVYEDLGANFLVLENLTSHAFISQNAEVSYGGIEEGLHTFFVLHELLNTDFAKHITSLHLIGLSLGGHGVFVTALLDQFNGRNLKAVLNLCPVINLKETNEIRFSPGLENALVDIWNKRRLKEMQTRYENNDEIQNWWKTWLDFKPRFTPAVNRILNSERKKPLLSVEDINRHVRRMKWPPKFAEHLTDASSFDELNYFWPLYRGVQTPVTIYTTPNDPLVPNEINSEKIFRGQQSGDFKSLQYTRLDQGVHCGLPTVYKWEYIVKLMREGLLL